MSVATGLIVIAGASRVAASVPASFLHPQVSLQVSSIRKCPCKCPPSTSVPASVPHVRVAASVPANVPHDSPVSAPPLKAIEVHYFFLSSMSLSPSSLFDSRADDMDLHSTLHHAREVPSSAYLASRSDATHHVSLSLYKSVVSLPLTVRLACLTTCTPFPFSCLIFLPTGSEPLIHSSISSPYLLPLAPAPRYPVKASPLLLQSSHNKALNTNP